MNATLYKYEYLYILYLLNVINGLPSFKGIGIFTSNTFSMLSSVNKHNQISELIIHKIYYDLAFFFKYEIYIRLRYNW